MKASPSSRSSGVALVLVLSFLALITIIVTAFFFSVSSQVAISDATSASATTAQLADSAVNVVMAQIVDATKGQSTKSLLAWASQPGMIRTYDTNSRPGYYYKLYSSDLMTVDASTKFTPDDLTSWKQPQNREIYTDLNAPGLDAQGDLVFPIVDPAADGTGSVNRPADKAAPFKVDGFSITSPPGYNPGTDEGPNNNRAPMPAMWLYQLRDGTLVAPVQGDATYVKVPGATAANPITGRIAFWTDDESGKININTASEGTYWDTPRAWTFEDFGTLAGANSLKDPGLAVCQPVQHEFQRYPGHPATTCLSPVFGSLPGMKVPYPYPAVPSKSGYPALDFYYNIAARIGLPNQGGGGGSAGGSKLYVDPKNAGLTVDTDRLYASVDELMFTPLAAPPIPPAVAPSRKPNTAAGSSATPGAITKSVLEKARFFLTANSSAPETTLFNTPRVSIWPVWANANTRTPFDQLSSFCSTVQPGGSAQPYYFTRSNPRSQTADLTPRNLALYQYLRKMTSMAIPGFGGNFQTKYPVATVQGPVGLGSGTTECDQILTEIYDYIRCTSIQDRSNGATPFVTLYGNLGAGEVLPIRMPNGTQGFGRFDSIGQAALLFYSTDYSHPAKPPPVTRMRAIFLVQFNNVAQGLGAIRNNLRYKVNGLDQLSVQFPGDQPQSLNFKPGGANYIDISEIALTHGRAIGGSEMPNLALAGKTMTDCYFDINTEVSSPEAGGDAHGKYPFFSAKDVAVPPQQPLFDFLGNPNKDITIEISDAGDKTAAPIQILHLRFPAATGKAGLRVPQKPQVATPPTPTAAAPTQCFMSRALGGSYRTIDGSQNDSGDDPTDKANKPDGNDTIIALQVGGTGIADASATDGPEDDPTAGDSRLVAGAREVPHNYFRPHNDYLNTTTTRQFSHGFLMAIGEYMHGGKYGKLAPVPDTPVRAYYQGPVTARQPDVPSRAKNGVYRDKSAAYPGDWDTGWGDQKDGAYINKPDEGDTIFSDGYGTATRTPYALGYGVGFTTAANGYFAPTRLVPSPMMFGSLSTGVLRAKPWQTLSFAPRPEDKNHPGNSSPRDHLLADLFWMPVVEPYAISQPFATSGKINLNSQLMPFSYIHRQTGLYAVLKATKFAALPVQLASGYKPLDGPSNGQPRVNGIRNAIDLPTTVSLITQQSDKNPFRSATQICEVNLVPQGLMGPTTPPLAADSIMANFWKANRLTGDNLREKPYVDLYPRLTTKSNTFTVHVRVQTLKKQSKSTLQDRWVTASDLVLGEYRGSTILERYVDLNDTTLPDFATAFTGDPATSPSLDKYYKMRVVSTKRFAP